MDDVMTTNSTTSEAASVLLKSGAAEVVVAVLGCTDLFGRPPRPGTKGSPRQNAPIFPQGPPRLSRFVRKRDRFSFQIV